VTSPDQPASAAGSPAPPEESPPPPVFSTPVAHARPPAPNLAPLLIAVLVLAVAAGAAAFLLFRPRLAFTNHLAAPVRVTVANSTPRVVAPGATARIPLSFGQTLVAEWELVRPLSADSTPMGEPVRGSAVARNPRGVIRASAETQSGTTSYFAPLLTNATAQPLRVMVNAGLMGALDCGCAVRAGATRAFIGYYRLFQNSSVQVKGPTGMAIFRDLGARVTTIDGTVGLRFEEKDLTGAPAPVR
jgi:hypothetical protein